MNKLISVLILILSLNALLGEDLPEPPTGYSWNQVEGMEAAFLSPEGWHFVRQDLKDTVSLAISKESVKESGSFETGFTVQIVKNLFERNKFPPSVQAIPMGQAISEKKENTILNASEIENGPFKGFVLRFRNAPVAVKPIIVHKLFLANDLKDTLWIITFEAPEIEWDEAWKTGSPILKQMMLDDEY